MSPGDKDQTWLDRAFSERSYFMAVYLPADARLDNLRADPRFAALKPSLSLSDVSRSLFPSARVAVHNLAGSS
jgi:hypothetical protein